MSHRYEIRSSIFDFAAFLARQKAAVVLAQQGHKCAACNHPVHAGHCAESSIEPFTPLRGGRGIPNRCRCVEGGLRLTEETRMEVA
jgi:hypothetical protein